jgi:hypothetical protein
LFVAREKRRSTGDIRERGLQFEAPINVNINAQMYGEKPTNIFPANSLQSNSPFRPKG